MKETGEETGVRRFIFSMIKIHLALYFLFPRLKNFLPGFEAGACSLWAPPPAFICPKGTINNFT
jgi:hypothetical protein